MGRPQTTETKYKIRLAHLGKYTCENNHKWKGDEVTKGWPLHSWVRRHFPMPEVCDNCRQNKKLDLANITRIYSRDFSNWKYLCRSCHMYFDYENGIRKGRGV